MSVVPGPRPSAERRADGAIAATPGRSGPLWAGRLLDRRRLRRALGVVWLLDAALQAQPDLFTAAWWRDTLAQSVMGEPSAINHSIFWAIGIVSAHAAVFNALFVATQAFLGISLLSGRAERVAIVLSVAWAVGIWWVGEGFGLLPTGFAMAATGAPGAVIVYPILALLAWPDRPGPSSGGDNNRLGVAEGPARGVWIGYWVGSALLAIPWAFPVAQVVRANISELGGSGPTWLESVVGPVQDLAISHPVLCVSVAAAAQVVIGVGILAPRYRRPILVAALSMTALYWTCFQGLGGVLSGLPSDATDVQTAPLIALLALSLWPTRSSTTLFRAEAGTRQRVRVPFLPAASSSAWSATLGAYRICALDTFIEVAARRLVSWREGLAGLGSGRVATQESSSLPGQG